MKSDVVKNSSKDDECYIIIPIRLKNLDTRDKIKISAEKFNFKRS